MKRIVFASLLLATPAFAQEPTLEDMTQAYFRETGQDRLVIASLQKQVADLKKELAAKSAPPATPPVPEVKKP